LIGKTLRLIGLRINCRVMVYKNQVAGIQQSTNWKNISKAWSIYQ